jgi:hypothetical protein
MSFRSRRRGRAKKMLVIIGRFLLALVTAVGPVQRGPLQDANGVLIKEVPFRRTEQGC